MKTVLLLIVLLPFAGFLVNGLGRKFFPKSFIAVNASTQILAAFVLSIIAFMEVRESGGQVIKYFDFIHAGSVQIPFALQIDQLSSLFLLIITGAGTKLIPCARYRLRNKTS